MPQQLCAESTFEGDDKNLSSESVRDSSGKKNKKGGSDQVGNRTICLFCEKELISLCSNRKIQSVGWDDDTTSQASHLAYGHVHLGFIPCQIGGWNKLTDDCMCNVEKMCRIKHTNLTVVSHYQSCQFDKHERGMNVRTIVMKNRGVRQQAKSKQTNATG